MSSHHHMSPLSPLSHPHTFTPPHTHTQLLVGAMGPPGGGRNHVTGRFTRHLNVVSIESFEDSTLTKIFSSLVDWHFNQGFEAIFNRLGKVWHDVPFTHP